MELKEYQRKALEAFSRWLEALEKAEAQAATVAAAVTQAGVSVPDELRNYPRTAWKTMADSGEVADPKIPHVDRTDDALRPIPHVCFKIPTGGGKTLLGTAALELMSRQTGLVLWIMPTRAIYQQTKDAFKNREHPYRDTLEKASGHRLKLLEKDDRFTYGDVVNYLCVMLLMLPATNRQKGREFLRMFRDSGRYPTLFPDSDDALGDGRLLEKHPDLERASEGGPVKHSLFNVFKMLRPVVILDEAHKAYGRANDAREFVQSVNRLDPSLVIELSATPNRNISNLLVDISGEELHKEQMIKLPVQVRSTARDITDWQYTLGQAHEELERLDAEAKDLQNAEGRYIRPIAVVRVERTGKDQEDLDHVHSEKVRKYLTTNLAVPANAVRVKSAENDELGREPLLSEYSPVRWIITKSALMEGWDCPFAYVLVMLDNTQAQRAITQLVGRVIRQPHTRSTGREKLDQCYVYCWNTNVGLAVQHVKDGLEQEGLTGLGNQVLSESTEMHKVTLERREKYRGHAIFLPQVSHKDGDGWRKLDFDSHILPEVDWSAIGPPDAQTGLVTRAVMQSAAVSVGDVPTVFHPDQELYVDKSIRISWFARKLADLVPNPWQAARIVQELMERLRTAGHTDDWVYGQRSLLASCLREHVTREVEKQTRKAFETKLRAGLIDFSLEAGRPSYEMIDSYEVSVDSNAHRYWKPMQLSLFEPVYPQQFDTELERNFAFYLEEKAALQWWHRVAARQKGGYYIRGWKRERIWPDFVALGGEKAGQTSFLIFETKGEHLKGNEDTEYKHAVFEMLENSFNGRSLNAGKVTVHEGPAKGVFRLVFGPAPHFPDAEQAFARVSGTYTTG